MNQEKKNNSNKHKKTRLVNEVIRSLLLNYNIEENKDNRFGQKN